LSNVNNVAALYYILSIFELIILVALYLYLVYLSIYLEQYIIFIL